MSNQTPTPDKFLSRQQLAARWGMCSESIKRRQAKGLLRAYMLGSAVRYKLAEIEAIEANSITTN